MQFLVRTRCPDADIAGYAGIGIHIDIVDNPVGVWATNIVNTIGKTAGYS